MNADMNLAAWMIAGGFPEPDPAAERNRAHLRAIGAARQGTPTIANRIATAIGARRGASASLALAANPRAELRAGCCAA